MTLTLALLVGAPAWAKGTCAKTDFKACKAACAKRDARSCVNLSMLYLDLETGSRATNDKLARQTMEKACKLKLGEACVYAGTFSDAGRGGKRDAARARSWWETGCKLKNGGACWKIAELLYDAEQKPASVKYFEAACKNGESGACGALGQMEVQGDGIPRNGRRGVKRLTALCDRGVGRGCVEAGVAWELGEVDGTKDRARAMALYTRGCNATKADSRGCTYAARDTDAPGMRLVAEE